MPTFTSASRCRDCQKEIVFVQDTKTRRWIPYGAIALGNGEYVAVEPHGGKCSVKVKKRIEDHCIGCQFDAGRSILSVWNLVGYMRCERHDNPRASFQYRGRTYGYDRGSLILVYREALKERKQQKRRQEKAGPTLGLDGFGAVGPD